MELGSQRIRHDHQPGRVAAGSAAARQLKFSPVAAAALNLEPVLPPLLPAHIYAQQVMALTLQEGGITRPDLEAWLADVAACVPAEVRDAVLHHMLSVGVLTEDEGVIGLGVKSEREFGRRHFSDLVAAFSSPLRLTVFHGSAELGSDHPASLARLLGDAAPVLLLGGRSWKVLDVDWPRRRVVVTSAESGGRSRWLGTGRMLSFAVCRAQERIVGGAKPGCHLSHRAIERLGEVRADWEFIDGNSLPLVSDGEGKVTAWLFAGGLVSASLGRGLGLAGLTTAGWDDVSVTARAREIDTVSRELSLIDTTTAHPMLPEDMANALKFGPCLPPHIAEAVLIARTSRPQDVAAAMGRPQRRILASNL